jgi:hypothetical protein
LRDRERFDPMADRGAPLCQARVRQLPLLDY